MAAIAGALSEDDLRRAARGSIYVRAAKIVLQYFNHEHNRLPDALGDIQLQARQWCVRYFGARTFAEVSNSHDTAFISSQAAMLIVISVAHRSHCTSTQRSTGYTEQENL